MKHITGIFLYLGAGFATQVVGYGDTTFHALVSPDASLSVWAHILAWPLFLLLLCGYYVAWFFVGVLVVALGVLGWMLVRDALAVRRRAKARGMRR